MTSIIHKSEEKHYKAIVIILSSTDEPIYKNFRQLQSLYLDLYKDDIKYFFLEFNENLDENIIEQKNFIYVKGKESIIPGMYIKTMTALNYIYNQYSFDFIVRTNLSTIFNIPYLLSLLDKKPKDKYAGGFSCRDLISGTNIILSKDICKLISENMYDNTNNIDEDVFITYCLRQLNVHIDFINQNEYKFIHFVKENVDSKQIFENIDYSNVLCFRIKNTHNREIIDIFYITTILKELYNLHPYDYPQNLFT